MLPYKQSFDPNIRNNEEYSRAIGFDRTSSGDGSGGRWDQWEGYDGYLRSSSGLGNGDLGSEGSPWHLEMDREEYRSVLDGPHERVNMRPHNSTYRDATHSQVSSFHHHPSPHLQAQLIHSHSSDTLSNLNARTTLWWGDLEPWMDEEYVKQVCALMGWDNNSGNGEGVTVKIPHPAPDHQRPGNIANNPGYCFLTFPTTQQAASVLARLNEQQDRLPTMPNSSRPFNLNWASNLSPASTASAVQDTSITATAKSSSTSVREYSIFVGDLAPEASNSDLLAVFRNPILGLRSDRAPKVVKPFYSAKSAKIMLDPVTGISKGYGFVRFTDQAEQQRALMEMHGLYCLSRPMRVSPATAKFKPASPPSSAALPGSNSFMSSVPSLSSSESHSFNASFDCIPTPNRSVSTPLAGMEQKLYPPQMDPRLDFSLYQQLSSNQSAAAFEESWNSPANAQARAILASLTGPNGEQLSSADPYNTTVFVGGLSPLISEETLRTFFAPFGDIHYVKVPVGKHCGFVQFVRKADAQRAIDRMQGFPIGGSRIRLSWGRSQYKAAQAVVQQAQIQAQLQAQHAQHSSQQFPVPPPVPSNQTTPKNIQTGPTITAQLTPQQVLDLLSRYSYQIPSNRQQQHVQHGPEQVPFSPPPLAPQHQQTCNIGAQNGLGSQDISLMNTIPRGESQHSHGGFSPFESQPLNEVLPSQSQVFNRTPGFGPSMSLPADLRITPQRSNQSATSGSPCSASTRTVFSNGDGASYSHFFDGGSRGYHLNVADILRKDSQALPRSNSNSSHRGEQTEGLMSQSHTTSFMGGKATEFSDMNGMLKNLSLESGEETTRLVERKEGKEVRHTLKTGSDSRQSKEAILSPHPVDVD